MEQDLTTFRVPRGKDITIGFPDPSQVASLVVNQQATAPAGSITVTRPADDKSISSMDVAVDPSRSVPVEVQIHSGSRVFHHFILPNLDLARFRFVYEESEPQLVYCKFEDDYVMAGPNGRCPVHG